MAGAASCFPVLCQLDLWKNVSRDGTNRVTVLFHGKFIVTQKTKVAAGIVQEIVGVIGRMGIMTSRTVSIPEGRVLGIPESQLLDLRVAGHT